MNFIRPLMIAAFIGCGFAIAQPVYTSPVGYVSITCPANSDTIVGLPLRASAAYSGALSANPDTTSTPGSAILSLAGSPGLTANELAGAYYAKLSDTTPTPAAGDGQWFEITANSANSITVNLNGGSITAVSGAQLEVLKFWTLAELFPPADCTTDPATTGNAIAASLSTMPWDRRTEILYPDLTSNGTNLAAAGVYFVHNGNGWRKQGEGNTVCDDTVLWPDVYFIVRNGPNVSQGTTYTISGEVEMGAIVVPLKTYASGAQDNFIGVPRAVDAALSQLNLGGTSAFESSASTLPWDRKDELFVFNNATVGFNKSASEIFFYVNGSGWRKQGDGNVNHDSTVISAGSGFVVRKATSNGTTQFWTNKSNY